MPTRFIELSRMICLRAALNSTGKYLEPIDFRILCLFRATTARASNGSSSLSLTVSAESILPFSNALNNSEVTIPPDAASYLRSSYAECPAYALKQMPRRRQSGMSGGCLGSISLGTAGQHRTHNMHREHFNVSIIGIYSPWRSRFIVMASRGQMPAHTPQPLHRGFMTCSSLVIKVSLNFFDYRLH